MKMNRIVSLLLVIAMCLSMLPTTALAGTVFTSRIEPETDIGATLDYDSLRETAYVVNAAWTGLTAGKSLTYSFRGKTYTETYDPNRHFATMAAAYQKHKALGRTDAPVFVLAPGTFDEARLSIPGGFTVLGANAGISPNAERDLWNTDPRTAWAANPLRGSETVIKGGFALTSANADTTVILDGISYNGSTELVSISNTGSNTIDVVVQNAAVALTAWQYVINDTNNAADSTNRYDFHNIRTVNSSQNGYFNRNASRVRLDRVYFAQCPGVISTTQMDRQEYSFRMQNSFVYQCTAGYNLDFAFTDKDHRARVTLVGNCFYNHCTGSWGAMTLRSTKASARASYEYFVQDNTFLRDSSVCNTFLNGNRTYQVGGYAMHINRNRVIGYTSLFPNIGNWTTDVDGNFDYNYFADTYSGSGDVLGHTSNYYDGAYRISDPFDIGNVLYYNDYAMTTVDDRREHYNNTNRDFITYGGLLDVTGVSFWDDADTVSIDNANSRITCLYTCGKTIQNPTLSLREDTATAKFYSDSACTRAISSIAAPAAGKSVTVYAKVTNFSRSKVVTVILNGAEAVPAFSSSFSDPTGTVRADAFLLAPQVAGLSRGTAFTAGWNGKDYGFTVGTNVFATTAEIFAAAGSKTPQILLLSQKYDRLSFNRACQVYGENYASAAAVGEGMSDWNLGSAWGSRKSAQVAGITGTAAGLEISGIELTDSMAATGATVKNSIINMENKTVFNLSGTCSLSGLYFKGTGNQLLEGTLGNLTMTGCYSETSLNKLFSAGYGTSGNSLTITDSRFDVNSSARGTFIPSMGGGSLTVKNNAICSDLSETASVFYLAPSSFASLTIRDNDFIGSGILFKVDYRNNSTARLSFVRNRVVGFDLDFAAADAGQLTMPVNVSDNYFGGGIPSGVALCDSYFADSGLTAAVDPFDLHPDEALCQTDDLLEAILPDGQNTFDLAAHVTVPNGAELRADGKNLSAIACTEPCTAVKLQLSYAGNEWVQRELTLQLYHPLPAGTEILNMTSSRGSLSRKDGVWQLMLPADADTADLSLTLPQGARASFTRVSGVNKGETKQLTLTITNGSAVGTHSLTVTRLTDAKAAVDYNAAVNTAYIIDSDWTNLSSGSKVSFWFRGQTYTQTYDPNRHFASFEAAYAHWLAGNPDLLHDTPVFLLTEGNYGNLTYAYRAVILGSNAGIDPNDPTKDACGLLPGGDIAANPNWSTAHETVITGSIQRTTRVNGGMSDLSMMRALQAAEDAARGEKAEFLLIADGLTVTGGGDHKFFAQDTDVGSWSDSTGSMTIRGYRQNHFYLQNLRIHDVTKPLYRAWDTSWNYNTLVMADLRITGLSSYAIIQKYVDTLLMDGVYMSGSALTTSIFDTGNGFNPHHNMDFTIRNSAFVNNNLTRLIRLSGDSYGDYQKTNLNIYANAFLETGSAEWGLIVNNGTLANVTMDVHDNLFCQTGSYNGVTIRTAIEGNAGYHSHPMTLRVNRNRFIGFETFLPNLSGIADDVLAAESYDFAGNYFAPSFSSADDVKGTTPAYIYGPEGNVEPILKDDFFSYLDYAMTSVGGELEVTGVSFAGQRAEYSVSGNTITVSLDHDTTGRLFFRTASGLVQQSLTRNGATVQSVSYRDVLAGQNTCQLQLRLGGCVANYTVKLAAKDFPEFTEAFTDPDIPTTALMLSSDAQGLARGEKIAVAWQGSTYLFTVGENIFSDLDSLTAARKGHLDLLLPAGSYGDLTIPGDCTVYGANYNIDPNVKGADISDDWAKNPAWGRYGETRTGSVSIAAASAGTEIIIKGITLDGYFNDSLREVNAKKTTIVLENTVIAHTRMLSSTAQAAYTWYAMNLSSPNARTNVRNLDEGILRNIRVEKIQCTNEISNGRNRLLNETLPAHFTMDGVYCDMTAAGVSLFGWWKMAPELKEGELNITNCNFRNGIQMSMDSALTLEGRNKAVNQVGTHAVLNLRGNCFYNTQTSQYGLSIFPYAYSKIHIEDNLFLSTSAKTVQFLQMAGTDTPSSVTDILHISGNRFVGVSSVMNNGMAEPLDLSGNYAADYSSNFKTATTTKHLTGSNTRSDWHYLNYALTSTSDGRTRATRSVSSNSTAINVRVAPAVFLCGSFYRVVWSTDVAGYGYVEYEYQGQTKRVYDEKAGIVRTDDYIHTVPIPVEELDAAGHYTATAVAVTNRTVATLNVGRSVSVSRDFYGYHGQEEINIWTSSDIHRLGENAGRMTNVKKAASYLLGGKPDVVALLGDIADSMPDKAGYAQYGIIDTAEQLSGGQIPVIYVRGNHETRGAYAPYLMDYLAGDTGELYFNCSYGPASFVVTDLGEDKLDTQYEYSGMVDYANYRANQTQWLMRDAKYSEDATYRLGMCHYPVLYTHFGYPWEKLYSNLGSDLLIGGHTHGLRFSAAGTGESHSDFPVIEDGGLHENVYTISQLLLRDGQIRFYSTNQNGNVLEDRTFAAGQNVKEPQRETELSIPIATAPIPMVEGSSTNFGFLNKPVVLDTGDAYTVAWATTEGKNSSGEVYLNYEGVTRRFTDSESGALRAMSNVHAVRIPKKYLDGNSYEVVSAEITNQQAYYCNKGSTITSGKIDFRGYNGQTDIDMLVVSDLNGSRTMVDQLRANFSGYDLLVLNGNSLRSVQSTGDIATQLLRNAAMLTGGSIPVVFARGENELMGAGAPQLIGVVRNSTRQFYEAVTYGPISMLVLDSSALFDDSQPDYNGLIRFDSVREKQTAWLAEQERSSDCNFRVVIAHAPITDQAPDADLTIYAHADRTSIDGSTVVNGSTNGDGTLATLISYTGCGARAKTVSVTGETLVEKTVFSRDHQWDEGTITTEATCTADGTFTFRCTTCGETRTQFIPATGHTTVIRGSLEATCTESGYTGDVFCTTCNTVVTAGQVLRPKGHSYVNGSCSVCGADDPAFEAVRQKLRPWTVSISLRSDLAMNYYVRNSVLNGVENPYIIFTKTTYDEAGNPIGSVSDTVSVYGRKSDSYVFTFRNIAAREMNSKITARVCGTYQGRLLTGDAFEYSVHDYAMRLLNADGDVAMQTLLVNMLNYGAAAQVQFRYNQEHLVNAGVSDEFQSLVADQPINWVKDSKNRRRTTAVIHYSDVSLSLKDRIMTNIYLNLSEYTGKLSELELVISYDGKDVVIDNSKWQGNKITFDELTAAQLRTVITIIVRDKTTKTQISDTYLFSPESYAYVVKFAGNQPESLVNLVEQMTRYGDSAQDFLIG